jgi:hypothetical protein
VTAALNIFQTNGGRSGCFGFSSWYAGTSIPGAENQDKSADAAKDGLTYDHISIWKFGPEISAFTFGTNKK